MHSGPELQSEILREFLREILRLAPLAFTSAAMIETKPNPAETRTGGCHCGAVRFSVDLPEGWYALRCNCTLCSMKGNVMIDVPLDALTITRGQDELTLYTFGTHQAKHHFCRHCGIHPFHQLRSNPQEYGINAVCIDGMSPYDFAELPVYDGAHHPGDNGGAVRWAGKLVFVPESD